MMKEIIPDHTLSYCCLCWTSNPEIDMEIIISTWCAMVSKVISHEERLNLKLHHLTLTNKLSDVETSKCHDACCALLNMFTNTRTCLKVHFTDKCGGDCTTLDRNVLVLAQENQHLTMEIECNLPHVILWAGMTATHVIGPVLWWKYEHCILHRNVRNTVNARV